MKSFSLLAFAAHLTEIEAEMAVVTHEAMEHAAMLVETEAKAEIGAYQQEAGPFAAWAQLAPFTQADRVAKGFPADEPLLRTGDLRDSIEHIVGVSEAEVGSNSDIAVYQELGTSKIPPRSFLGGAAVRKSHDIKDICAIKVFQHLAGQGTKIRIP